MIFEHIFQHLHDLPGQLLRRGRVQRFGHGIHLAETVSPAQDLPPERALVLQCILIQLPHEPQPLFQQFLLLLSKAEVLGAAQLHIAAHRPHHEIHEEGQPVGRLVEEQQRRRALGPIARRQRDRRQKRRRHACVQAVDIGDEHDERQPEIHHPELRLGAGHPHQQFGYAPGPQQFQHRDQQPVPRGKAAEPFRPFFAAGLLFLPEESGQVVQQVVPGEPPIRPAQLAVVGRVLPDQVAAVGHGQAGAEGFPRLAQLLIVPVEDHRGGQALPLRRPVVEHPQHQLGQVFHAQSRHRGKGLLFKMQFPALRAGQQLRDAHRRTGAVGAVEIGQVQHLDLHPARLGVMAAESLRRLRQHRFADERRQHGFRPSQIKQLAGPLPVGLQNTAQAVQFALLLAVRGQILREIDDAVKLVAVHQLADALLAVQRDGPDARRVRLAPCAGNEDMVLWERHLHPGRGHETGVPGQ